MYDDEEMIPLNFGEMPSREVWNNRVPEEPYPMVIRSQDLWSSLVAVINQGIDSHLEVVDCEAGSTTGDIVIKDRDSLYTFLRRCTESDWGDMDENSAISLASSIMYTLNFEWI